MRDRANQLKLDGKYITEAIEDQIEILNLAGEGYTFSLDGTKLYNGLGFAVGCSPTPEGFPTLRQAVEYALLNNFNYVGYDPQTNCYDAVEVLPDILSARAVASLYRQKFIWDFENAIAIPIKER